MNNIIQKFLFIILFFAVFTSCKKTENGDIVISKINVVDVKNGLIIKEQDVIINGNRIVKIIPHNQVKLESSTFIDGTNRFLIPGLWDMHAHIRSYSSVDILPMFIMHGVTGIRDLGITNYELIKYWKSQIEKKAIIGPRIISSGTIIEGSGPSFPSSVVINKLEDVERCLDSLIAKNIQVVKLFHTVPSDVFKDIIRYSKEKGMVTSGHIPNDMNQIDASSAGLNSIEHLWGISNTLSTYDKFYVLDEEIKNLAETLIENGTFQTPTLVNMESYAKLGQELETNPNLELTPKYFIAWWANINEKFQQNFAEEDLLRYKNNFEFNVKVNAKLHELGVKILAGTDVPNPYIVTGMSLHNELEHFINSGMSTADALKTATLNPAQYFNRSSELGLIDENYIADLVVLDANPLENISNTQRIYAVIQNGRLFTHKMLQDLRSSQLDYLAEFSEDDFDQFIYMDVRRNGVESVRKKYANIDETRIKYKIGKHHLIRLSNALKEGLQLEEAIKILEWNLELFPEDKITKELLTELKSYKN